MVRSHPGSPSRSIAYVLNLPAVLAATFLSGNGSGNNVQIWPRDQTSVIDTVVDLDLRVKLRDPEASIRVALRGV